MAVCFMWLVVLPLERLPCGHFIGQLCYYGNLYLAAMLAHKEVLLLNVHLKPNEIENQLKQLGVTTVLHSQDRRNQLPDSMCVIEFEPLETILADRVFRRYF